MTGLRFVFLFAFQWTAMTLQTQTLKSQSPVESRPWVRWLVTQTMKTSVERPGEKKELQPVVVTYFTAGGARQI